MTIVIVFIEIAAIEGQRLLRRKCWSGSMFYGADKVLLAGCVDREVSVCVCFV